MILEFDEHMINNLKAGDVSKWYSEHHTEQDLADIYEAVHEMWVYYEDCTYDYEEGTPDFENAMKVFEEWDALETQLEDDIMSALRKQGINADCLDIKTLDTFMNLHGWEDHGGWYIKKEDFIEESSDTNKCDCSRVLKLLDSQG